MSSLGARLSSVAVTVFGMLAVIRFVLVPASRAGQDGHPWFQVPDFVVVPLVLVLGGFVVAFVVLWLYGLVLAGKWAVRAARKPLDGPDAVLPWLRVVGWGFFFLLTWFFVSGASAPYLAPVVGAWKALVGLVPVAACLAWRASKGRWPVSLGFGLLLVFAWVVAAGAFEGLASTEYPTSAWVGLAVVLPLGIAWQLTRNRRSAIAMASERTPRFQRGNGWTRWR